jgi:hypothetical protein
MTDDLKAKIAALRAGMNAKIIVAHIARCTPETIKDILDALEADEARVKELEEAMKPKTTAEAFDHADWYWSVHDPDDSDTNPYNICHQMGEYIVREIASSYSGPTRFAFIAPVDGSDDAEIFHFETREKAVEDARARIVAAIRKGKPR